MSRTISSSDAKSRFGEVLKWASEDQEEVVVKLYGEPTAVVISMTTYQQLEEMRKQERKRRALRDLEQLRREISAQFDDLSIEERYRMAGMSEETIREIVAYDQQLNLAPTMTVMP
jgi:prevent-host-death family protein